MYLIAVLQTILFDYTPFHLGMKVDDGHLEFLASNRISRLKMLCIFPEVMSGTHTRMKDCTLETFKMFELVSRQPLFNHQDAEIISTPETKPVTTQQQGSCLKRSRWFASMEN